MCTFWESGDMLFIVSIRLGKALTYKDQYI